jgi:cobalt/nickel transport system permease protein
MHVPDGFLDAKTAGTTAALAVAGVGLALHRVKRELPPRRMPQLGLAAAFLFTAQMINFPVAGGTSGHLIGGTLVAALLGPSAAVVVITTVLIVQCFLFQDGGVTALGANIFNMGIICPMVGYALYQAMGRWFHDLRGQVTALAFAAWCSTVAAAIACAGQLAWSHTIPWNVAFPAMAGVHMLIGIGEGLITALVFLAIKRTRPDWSMDSASLPPVHPRETILYGLLVTLGIAVFVAPFACTWPDGLDSVAAQFGFVHHAAPKLPAPAPNYQIPGVRWPVGATALAGVIGSLIVFSLAWLLGRVLVPKSIGPKSAE